MNAHRARRILGLLPDASWTLAHNVLSVAGALAAVKIIASFVTPEQYGQASLSLGIVTLLSQLIVFPLLTAHLRIHFDELRAGGADFWTHLRPLLTKVSLVMAGLYLMIAGVQWTIGHPGYLLLSVPALLLVFTQPRLSATFNALEARRRYQRLAAADVTSKVAPVGFLVLLLAAPISQAAAVLLAQGLAVAFVVLIFRPRRDGLGRGPDEAEPGPQRSAIGEYGWTLHLFSLVNWTLATSDRYVIEMFWSPSEVGRYTMNYGLCSMPFLMLNAWLELLVRSRVYGRAAAGDWRTVRTIVLGRLALASSLAVVGAAVFTLIGERLALFILVEGYWQGMRLALVLVVAHVFFVVANSFHILFVAAKRTDLLLGATLIAALVNIGMNLVIVPRMGIYGAALSTLAGYVVLCVGMALAGLWLIRRLIAAQPRPS